jgi:DNA-binding Lrp family transcriptional regulator
MDTDADIDETDRQLLDALVADGRASARELATETGVATGTATKRLRDLEDAGVIEGYQAEVDYAAFGYEVTAIFRLKVDGSGLSDIVDELRSHGRTIGVYEVTGDADVIAIGKFTSTDEMNEAIKRLVTHENVRSASTSVVLDTVREYGHPPILTPE